MGSVLWEATETSKSVEGEAPSTFLAQRPLFPSAVWYYESAFNPNFVIGSPSSRGILGSKQKKSAGFGKGFGRPSSLEVLSSNYSGTGRNAAAFFLNIFFHLHRVSKLKKKKHRL